MKKRSSIKKCGLGKLTSRHYACKRWNRS